MALVTVSGTVPVTPGGAHLWPWIIYTADGAQNLAHPNGGTVSFQVEAGEAFRLRNPLNGERRQVTAYADIDLWDLLQRGDQAGSTPAPEAPPGFAVARGRSVMLNHELGVAKADSQNPVGEKPMVLAEASGSGVLEEIWFAGNGGNQLPTSFVESGGRVRVFLDNDTEPAIDQAIHDFYMYGPRGGQFNNERVGRTKRAPDSGSASGFRRLYAPFRRYMRVEVINKTTAEVGAVYGHAVFRYDDSPRIFNSYKVASVTDAAFPSRGKLTVIDMDGAGQLEHIYLSVSSGQDFEATFLEGNPQIFVDGEPVASLMASGTEDFFVGGWYEMPVGGYPAGRAADSDLSTGTHQTMYRFFPEDPIRFKSHIKVVLPIGQHNQGNMTPATVAVSASAGVWLDKPAKPALIPTVVRATPLLVDPLAYPAGALPTTRFQQAADRVQATSTGNSITFPTSSADNGQDMRVVRKGVTLPANYWVETKMRVTDANADKGAGLIVTGTGADAYFGGACHVTLQKANANAWQVRAFSDFDIPFVVNIGDGSDLTNKWVWLAMRVIGTKRTAYYRLDGGIDWHPLGTFTSLVNHEGRFGVYSWQCAAEFDQLNVYPVTLI